MGFFSRFFGKKKDASKLDNQRLGNIKKNNGIKYDPDLVSKLKSDHQKLLSIFGEVSIAAKDGKYDVLQDNLKKLKLNLRTHLMTENVRFYVYLQQELKNDPSSSSLVGDLKKEMDGIANVAIRFFNKYEKITFTPEITSTFTKELAEIGDVLVKRIETEESDLYTLYKA